MKYVAEFELDNFKSDRLVPIPEPRQVYYLPLIGRSIGLCVDYPGDPKLVNFKRMEFTYKSMAPIEFDYDGKGGYLPTVFKVIYEFAGIRE